ncbi:DUF3369 domain-containing protein [Pseudoalteromonas sp. G4]|uniref:DUF3369 domain-containing protein n=1 Tax=Pseudoalteromonas sp. G4 TaxID=2992761 RepID=UPI00237E4312|nr:DUF3369 domain-containing protein [Pseudoalteromonas sp. G4]MDE3270870.1 DUF3369 domain-containing protein [Pseudoalteromonas sp. G4]
MDWLAAETETVVNNRKPWKVVIVDDDIEVHKATKLAMKSFEFMGRRLEFYSAYSGLEGKALLEQHNDIAVILLDVVMETDDAGLKLVNYIRNTLQNTQTRIVLRTGQAGMAPESEVIKNYDIDGYKAKTEITLESLTHLFYVALRSYRDISRLGNYKNALKALLNSVLKVDKLNDLEAFSSNLLTYLSDVLDAYEAELVISKRKASMINIKSTHTTVVNAQADDSPSINLPAFIDRVATAQSLIYDGNFAGIYYNNEEDLEAVVGGRH